MRLFKYILIIIFSLNGQMIAEDVYQNTYLISEKYPIGIFGSINDNLYSITNTLGSNTNYLVIENKIKGSKIQIKLKGDVLAKTIIDNNIFLFSNLNDSLLINTFDSLGNVIKSYIYNLNNIDKNEFVLCDYDSTSFLFTINEVLYYFNRNTGDFNLLSESILSAKLMKSDIYYIKNNQNGAGLFRYRKKKEEIINSKINLLNSPKMLISDKSIYIISGIKFDNTSEIIEINIQNGQIKNNWIDANIDNLYVVKNKFDIVFIKNDNKTLSIVEYNIIDNKILKELPINDNSSLIKFANGKFANYAIFNNMILSFDSDYNILSKDYIQITNDLENIDFLLEYNNSLILSNSNKCIFLSLHKNKYWRLQNIYENFGKYLIPIILFLLLVFLFRIFMQQKRLLNIFINENTGGATIILDKNGRIGKLNKNAMQLLEIDANFSKRKKYSYYLVDEFTYQLKLFIDKSYTFKESFSQKLNFSEGNINQEWIFSSIPLNKIMGKFDGLLIKGVNITEELEKNRLYNWSQLAHDMQTNLTTIRLNTEQIKSNTKSEEERTSKILNQVNILIQRVRDIVTVGRTNELNLLEYDSAEICKEVMNEFDKTTFPDVVFKLEVSSFKMKCDKPKMIRAIRNAIENGIKSMKDNKGEIILSNSLDAKYYYFIIKDSGIGMDREVQKKMLTPYFTTGSKSGGFGIGTMIMQHVVELHGGELQINSEQNIGTEIKFAIPNIYKPRKGAKTITRRKIT